MNERLLVSQLLLEDEKRLQSERVEETLSLMEQPDSTETFVMPTGVTQHGPMITVEGEYDRRNAPLMDTSTCGVRDESRSDFLLPDDLEEHDEGDLDEVERDEDHIAMDQRSVTDTEDCDGRTRPCSVLNMHDMHGADSLDMDEGGSCQMGVGPMADPDSSYPRLASLSVPSVHSNHSQAGLGEDSLSELVTDGQLLSNQLLAQSDDPDLDNAVNSILFA